MTRLKHPLSRATDSSFGRFSVCFFSSLLLFSLATLYMSNVSLTHIELLQYQPIQRLPTIAKVTTLAGLSCDSYGGPSEDKASEMIYWEDIPGDRYDDSSRFLFLSHA
jgi:hypothetical protein